MVVEINMVQLVGIWLMILGLVFHSGIFLFAYFKIVSKLNKEDEDEDEEGDDEDKEKVRFPIVRFIFRFRKVASAVLSHEKREKYKKIITVVDWVIIIALVMIIIGFLLIVTGFLF